jgi:predicted O-methyltransferase YrrM
MDRSPFISEQVTHYLTKIMGSETPLQQRLRVQTEALPQAIMLTSPNQAALLSMLVRLTGAKRVLEIGTFTGYSALAIASALPDDGTLTCCDINEEWAAIAKSYWSEARIDHKITLHLAPALETLATLTGMYDLIFIDADKGNYAAYYEASLTHLRNGGLIILDNMLWKGTVADTNDNDMITRTLRELNEKIRDDPRVETCLLPIGDGMLLARKR